MRRGTSKLFVLDDLPDGRFHQIAACQKDARSLVDDDRFVTHDRKIGSPGHAASHHRRDLGDAHAAHDRVVAKNTAKMLLVWEDLILHGKKDPCAVDQVDDRDSVLHGDLLCPQVLLRRDRKPGSGLHRGVIGDDYA